MGCEIGRYFAGGKTAAGEGQSPCVGPSRPERVFTLITPASLSPNSAGMPPVALQQFESSRVKAGSEIADMLSVTGIPSITYCT